ncbi:16S rRNA (guanine(966)-N(2))-methyltransferase RsmD [Ammonifex thiophilus]|uniref:16S rRNA (Guanine(966)-N(2))-methyltransferase RsmD n=1 Tax=Ammonifex thiophilus TaxID=444093 RepID=A0A3D8P7H6_9THEO|nr:16S rRNA (guanine(966)-N(2))-methyltransferase RsmD [Ammonifex thiophilus]RDV84485.1 16S rRNA (guanine(966)-N(2))-methyltransferase RsmD [Ammonifex thiophilus]
MRVIGGEAKRCRLATLKGKDLRPTSERVKEALFNILANRVPGSRFLDLFAGTGGIGIEALSRGAESAVFVERDPRAVKLIRENLERTGLSNRAQVYGRDVLSLLPYLARKKERFDLVYIDPPYQRGYEKKVLRLLAELDLLEAEGLVVVESSARELPPDKVHRLVLKRRERYGDTALSFYALEEEKVCE